MGLIFKKAIAEAHMNTFAARENGISILGCPKIINHDNQVAPSQSDTPR